MNAREDRTLAEVKHGYERTPQLLPYDILVDTTKCDSESVAREVIKAMTLKV